MKKIFVFLLLVFSLSDCRSADDTKTQQNETAGSKNTPVKIVNSDSISINTSARVNELKEKLTDDFIVKGYSYFVIASNLSGEETDKILTGTIDNAVECFYNDYFSVKPDEATTIMLFKNDNTYRHWARKLYDDDDLSRYGYYKPSEKTMLMNINTGTGTLVHEMTHALVRYDFPEIPSWFNEGLGSLYERCSLNNKTILGYVNWRLPALQDAIKDKSYTALDVLVKTDWDEFYGARSEFNYAQARYLCMYLQETGLLKKFYKNFRDTYKDDMTGKTQLEAVSGKSLKELEADFLSWVATLSYE